MYIYIYINIYICEYMNMLVFMLVYVCVCYYNWICVYKNISFTIFCFFRNVHDLLLSLSLPLLFVFSCFCECYSIVFAMFSVCFIGHLLVSD